MKASEAKSLTSNYHEERRKRLTEAQDTLNEYLNDIKNAANSGRYDCPMIWEYHVHYPVVREELERLGYKIITKEAYTEYISWRWL